VGKNEPLSEVLLDMALVSHPVAVDATPLRSFQHPQPQRGQDIILPLLNASLASAGFDIVAPLAIGW
jgi:hypothetical protein